jgi:glycerol-3-phosphate acyltransferase PlsX
LTTKKRLIRVAVDAMGGDHAPAEIVAGAVQAARQGDVQVMLVGDSNKVQPELARHDTRNLPIGAIPSEGVIMEGEPPALALRQKPRASILVATGMVKQGHADACVTMGSTGAAMAAAAVVLGVTEGIERPALGGPIIGLAPHTVIIDLGTNVDCRPGQLLSFAVIGSVFARQFWGIGNPRVALLSVGAEAGKGNRQVKETTELFASSGLNFIGNVEGYDLAYGKAEVVVCDGFVGNIVMKLTEGLGQAISEHLRSRLVGKLPAPELEQLVKEVYELNNVVETLGGGPMFGVNGVSVVGHGRARADAVQRAIGTARRAVESGFVSKLNEELARMRARVGN